MKKPTLTLVKPNKMNAKSVAYLFRALTGKEMTEQEKVRAENMFAK